MYWLKKKLVKHFCVEYYEFHNSFLHLAFLKIAYTSIYYIICINLYKKKDLGLNVITENSEWDKRDRNSSTSILNNDIWMGSITLSTIFVYASSSWNEI